MFPKAQKRIAERILNVGDGAYLAGHLRPDGVLCFRLLTSDHSPICNIGRAIIRKMMDRDYFDRIEGRIGKVLSPSLKMREAIEADNRRIAAIAERKAARLAKKQPA